ncbi:E3 ubiquitin-protein ligase DCST1 [Erinaceus europaeus]|uniref:E3 ubiquitin-protein ligase DCST1 n=1 Tax=Erinaceus europaeus TaxID=9365 RepID=A0ABM3YB97_ERIEU|nr:E3 ubiquitin-protein ligase DCST1 [Erinaceus europaeus]
MDGVTGHRRKLPHTTLQRFLSWGLPRPAYWFLERQPGEFPITAVLLGASTGGLLAIGLFQLLVNPMNLYEEQKMVVLYSVAGLGAVGWGTSPHIRCASLLLVPKMLGKEGRLFVMGYALAAIYDGPVSNLRHNLHEVIASVGCTVELQINNTRAAWRTSTAPLRAVFKDLLLSKESLKVETKNISDSFEELDAQVNSKEGYAPQDVVAGGSKEEEKEEKEKKVPVSEALRAHLSTQKMYELRTKLRCSYVVSQAVLSCRRWFNKKHTQCMQRIWVPLLSHLLCVPMKFKFFCSIAKVMEVWCRSRIPVEGNFGQTYDSLNQSLHGLDAEFSATIHLEEQKRVAVLGLNRSWERMSSEVQDYVRSQEARLEWGLGLLHLLLSCTFLIVLQALALGSHKLEVKVGGHSMLARLLRKTIGALNTSSETVVESHNMPCLPLPVHLGTTAYLRAVLPVGLLLGLCLLQAFAYRLRRAIAAFYFPKREKKRILFLYNELLRKRAAFTRLRRADIVQRARLQQVRRPQLADLLQRRCPLLRHWLRRRCVVCQAPETPESYVCQTAACGAVYCNSCWVDMKQQCPACTPPEELSSSAYNDSDDDATYAE